MIALKMTLALNAEGLMPIDGMTKEDAQAKLTDKALATLREEVMTEWRKNLMEAGFVLLDGCTIGAEVVEV